MSSIKKYTFATLALNNTNIINKLFVFNNDCFIYFITFLTYDEKLKTLENITNLTFDEFKSFLNKISFKNYNHLKKLLFFNCYLYAEFGCIKLLKFARQNGHEWDIKSCIKAALGGHFNILKWLRSQDPPCPWNELTCSAAVNGGHFNILKWLRSQDPPCPWNERSCKYAAENGNLDILKWLRNQYPPCPWDESTCEYATKNGHLNCLKYAIENNCPFDLDPIKNDNTLKKEIIEYINSLS